MKKTFLTFLIFSSLTLLVQAQANDPVKVGVVNFRLTGQADVKKHVARIDNFAKEAKSQGANYLLLPELMIFDMLPEVPAKEKIALHLEELVKLAPLYEHGLVEISKNRKINIVGASLVVKGNDGLLNRAFYINDKGVVRYQDKIWPTPWEVTNGFIAGKDLNVFKTPEFSFVILICHDVEFPTVSVELIKSKPEIIFVTSQTDDVEGLRRVEKTSAARAIEHMAYVLLTGDSGDADAKWHSYIGQNFLFSPYNSYFKNTSAPGAFNKEELSIFTLDLKILRKSRGDLKQVYPARDVLSK